jgi:hypothetical protein
VQVTIVNTMTPLPHTVDDEMNIGKPLPNNTVYVLDEELRPLPIGETGMFLCFQSETTGLTRNLKESCGAVGTAPRVAT